MLIKTLYLNGQIFTANPEMPFAEAMAVSVGSINLVGSNDEILASVGAAGISDPKLSEMEVIDLAGKTVIPGFIDADIRPEIESVVTEGSSSEIAAAGRTLAEKGIVGLAVCGACDGRNVYSEYFSSQDKGLEQYISVYYPLDFVAKTEGIFDDKMHLVRDRKVHIAGITIPGERGTSKEDEETALSICKENGLQLSVEISETDQSEGLIEALRDEENWLDGSDIPNIRVHKGRNDFNPFIDIKKDLTEEVERAEREGGNTEYIDLSTEVMGYTKYSAVMSGIPGIGEIKAGNKACFIITDRSLASISVEELDQVKPEVTIIDGHIAYKAEGSSFSLRDNNKRDLTSGSDLRLTK